MWERLSGEVFHALLHFTGLNPGCHAFFFQKRTEAAEIQKKPFIGRGTEVN